MDVQSRLRDAADTPMLPEFLELQEKSIADFKAKREADLKAWEDAIEAKWVGLATKAEKVKVDPRRFLEETFPLPRDDTGEDVVVIETYSRGFSDLVCKLNLAMRSLKVPLGSIKHAQPTSTGDWTIVGRNQKVVDKKYYQSVKEFEPAWKRQREEKARMEERQRKERARKEEEDKNAIQERHQEVIQKSGSIIWDVTGLWRITCPALKAYAVSNTVFTLRIYFERVSGKQQMFAEFNFNAVKGVFRFERQSQAPPKKSSSKKRKRPNEDEIDTDDEEADLEESYNRRSPSPEAFRFGPPDKPSSTKPTWKYRWRGIETGEGQIQLDSDRKSYSITFGGPKGTEMSGTFGGGNFEKCKFSGVKIEMGGKSSIDIGEEWESKNERAHGWAARARWH